MQTVEYTSSKEASSREDALQRALRNGQAKARILAEAAECRIDKPLSIDEQQAYYVQRGSMNSMDIAPGGTGTPGAVAGRIQFNSKVVVTYDLLPK